MRRYGFDHGGEPAVKRWIDRPMLDRGARGVVAKEVVAVPVNRRSDGSGYKSAAAVRADVLQDVIDAGRAEGALLGADARFRVGRQFLI